MPEPRSRTWNVPVPCEPHPMSPTLVLEPSPFKPHLPTLIQSPGAYTFLHSFLPKTLKAGCFQSLFNIPSDHDSFTKLTLFSLFIFSSPLGGHHMITHVFTHIPSDLMTHSPKKETSLKTDMTSYPEDHCPLQEAQALLSLSGSNIWSPFVFLLKTSKPLLVSLSCCNRISIGDIPSKTMILVNVE